MPFNPFSALTSKIFAGASAVLLIALIACWVGWSHAANQRDEQIRDNGALRLKLGVSNASIDSLTATITELNNRALANAQAYAAAKAEAAKASAKLDVLSQESDKRIAALRAAAKEQYNGDCPLPDSLAKLAEGL